MEHTVEQLESPNSQELLEVMELFKGIPGRTCSRVAYLDYLQTSWLTVAVFVVKNSEGVIVGFTQAEAPRSLDPLCAWLPFSHALPECPHDMSVKAVSLAEAWMRGFGALRFKVTTVRNPEAFSRAWGMHRSNEVLMERDLP